jgi:epoxyqueuosine reductase
VARARVLVEHADRYRRALEASGPAALPYLARDPERRLDPARLLPGARTVVVCAADYRNERSRGYPPDFAAPRIASYALSDEYQPKIKGMLARMAALLGLGPEWAGGRGRGVEGPPEGLPRPDRASGSVDGRGQEAPPKGGGRLWRALCDTSPILEKAWAVEAGLGWVGRNSLLITPRHGSFLLLGELIVDDECDAYDAPCRGNGCGACRRCVEGCPASALVPLPTGGVGEGDVSLFGTPDTFDAPDSLPRVCALDTGRCIAALTIERSSLPPDPARLHGWLFGCDECQSLCPYNQVWSGPTSPLFAPRFDPADFSAAAWRAMGPEEFARRFADTPLRRAGIGKMKKNVPG